MRGSPLHVISFIVALCMASASAYAQQLGTTINRTGATVTGVTFRLWAPNATSVSVRGDFNNFGETALTKEAGSSGYWNGTVAAARPGHKYKYFLRWSGNSSGTWKVDPRSPKFDDGNSVIYDQSAFDWQQVSRTYLSANHRIMYEMHVGAFYKNNPSDGKAGTFDEAIQKLDYLQRLGINVIALMPVNEFGGDFSWGYNPQHVYAIEQAYGGPDGLKRFVREAHRRGIAVQMDVVHNHWNPDESGVWNFDGSNNIYFYSDARRKWTAWGDRPDYSKQEVRNYIQDSVRMFLNDFQIEGFRWDSAQNILGFNWNTNSVNPDNVNYEGKSLMTGINRMVQEQYPGSWNVSEDANMLAVVPDGYFGYDGFLAGLRVSDQKDSFDGHWQTSFHDQISSHLNSSTPDISKIFEKVSGWSEPPGYRVIFSDNHDKAGNLNKNRRLADRMDWGNPTSVLSRKKSLLMMLLTMTSPGTPMLFMGQEFHATGAFSEKQPMDWATALSEHRIFRAYKDAINLRKGSAALQNADLNAVSSFPDQSNGIGVYWRSSMNGLPTDDIVVCYNFSNITHSGYVVQFPSSGTWYVRMNTDWKVYGADFGGIGPVGSISVGGNTRAAITLAPYSVVILSRTQPAVAPHVEDANGNGMADGWEAMTGVTDPNADNDGDGISNVYEYQLGLDPNVADSVRAAGTFNNWSSSAGVMKASGVAGELEYIFYSDAGGVHQTKFVIGTNWFGLSGQPNQPTTDNIAFTVPPKSYVRLAFHVGTKAYSISTFGTSSALMVDSNANGLDDRWERFYGVNSATADSDADGLTNLQEFQRGSDPKVKNQKLVALAGDYNGWSASRNPLTYVGGTTTWFIDQFFFQGESKAFKFTDGSWDNSWGDALNTPSGNIVVTFSEGSGIYRFLFDEATHDWQVLYDPTDADGDGMQDAWESYFNVDDPHGDPDGDGIINLHEFRRGSSPHIVDRMSVVGNASPLTWNPDTASLRMTWSDAAKRWEWSGVFAAGTVGFKFATGPNGGGTYYGTGASVPAGTASASGASNLSATVPGGVMKFSFNETTGVYSVTAGAGVAEQWRSEHGLPANGSWTADTDNDGLSDLVEYAIGGNPRDSRDSKALQTYDVVKSRRQTNFTMTWLQRSNDSSVQVTPQASGALGVWSPLSAVLSANQADVPAGFQRREVSVPLTESSRFLRLKISKQ